MCQLLIPDRQRVATRIFFAPRFSHLSVTPWYYVTYSLILERSSLCIVFCAFSKVLVSCWLHFTVWGLKNSKSLSCWTVATVCRFSFSLLSVFCHIFVLRHFCLVYFSVESHHIALCHTHITLIYSLAYVNHDLKTVPSNCGVDFCSIYTDMEQPSYPLHSLCLTFALIGWSHSLLRACFYWSSDTQEW